MIEDHDRCKGCGLYKWQTEEGWEPHEFTCETCRLFEVSSERIRSRKGPTYGQKLGLIHAD